MNSITSFCVALPRKHKKILPEMMCPPKVRQKVYIKVNNFFTWHTLVHSLLKRGCTSFCAQSQRTWHLVKWLFCSVGWDGGIWFVAFRNYLINQVCLHSWASFILYWVSFLLISRKNKLVNAKKCFTNNILCKILITFA